MLFCMCGRYALAGDWSDFTEEFSLDEVPGLEPRYNIAPSAGAGFESPILTAGGLVPARFWFIPSWWNKPLKELPTSFNARSETVEEKKFFAGAQRCLVPLSGWREFPGPAGRKRAVQFHRERPFFAFGGIMTRWKPGPDLQPIHTFSILTAEPHEVVRPVHHRMPLLVPREDYEPWLDAETAWEPLLASALRESHSARLLHYEASTYGNSTKVEGPACIARAATQGSLF